MPRRSAQLVLERVATDAAYSNVALDGVLRASSLDARDRGLTTELVYGTLRWRLVLDRLLDPFLDRGIESVPGRTLRVLRLATYQLAFLDRLPKYAVINEAVEMAKEADPRKAGMVNAVLRKVAESVEARRAAGQAPPYPEDDDSVAEQNGLPDWFVDAALERWPEARVHSFFEALGRRPRTFVRTFGAVPEGVEPAKGLPFAGVVPRGAPLAEIVAKSQVMDLASQLATLYCGAERGDRVLDACAGLGGKSLALADLVGREGRVVAIDNSARKLKKLRKRARILRQADRIETATSRLQDFSLGEPFDIVLVDAPCTGLGVVRRHPERLWTHEQDSQEALISLQSELLDAATKHVRPGGHLVYSVCTFAVEETTGQVAQFLSRNPDFTNVGAAPAPNVSWDTWVDQDGFLDPDPGTLDCDAFFAARFVRKVSESEGRTDESARPPSPESGPPADSQTPSE